MTKIIHLGFLNGAAKFVSNKKKFERHIRNSITGISDFGIKDSLTTSTRISFG